MQACVLPVWLCCLSDFCCCCRSCCPLFVWFLFGAWSSHIIFPLSVFASTHVFVRSVFVSTLLVSLRPLSVFRRCLCQLCLCALFVSMWTRCVCAHSVFLHPLWLSAHSMSSLHDQSLPTLLLSLCSLGCHQVFWPWIVLLCLLVLFVSLLCLCFCCPLSD